MRIMNGDVVGLRRLVKQAMVRIRNSDLPAEEKAAARLDGGLADRLAAFHELLGHEMLLSARRPRPRPAPGRSRGPAPRG